MLKAMATKQNRELSSTESSVEMDVEPTSTKKRAGTPIVSDRANKKKIVVPAETEMIVEDDETSDENEESSADDHPLDEDDNENQQDDEVEEQQNDEAELLQQQKLIQAQIAAMKKKKQQKAKPPVKKNTQKTAVNNLAQAVKKNVRGVAKKVECGLLKELCSKINKIGGDKAVAMMSDLVEGVEYPIDSIKTFLARNDRAVVTVEFSGDRILYLPFLYRHFFLDEVFCVDNKLQSLRGKRSKYPVRGNELIFDKWFFRVEKSQETNYTEWILITK